MSYKNLTNTYLFNKTLMASDTLKGKELSNRKYKNGIRNNYFNLSKDLSLLDYLDISVNGETKRMEVRNAINSYPKELYATIIKKDGPKLSKTIYKILLDHIKSKEPIFYKEVEKKKNNKSKLEKTKQAENRVKKLLKADPNSVPTKLEYFSKRYHIGPGTGVL